LTATPRDRHRRRRRRVVRVAVLARHFKIPFFVAAPTSSIDLSLPTGNQIPIEQRDPREISQGLGSTTAPDDVDGARRLRRDVVQALTRTELTSASSDPTIAASPATMIGAIRTRLTEIIAELGPTKTATDEDDSML